MNTRRALLPFDPRCQRAIASNGVQIAAIANGETCVRYWSPWLIYGTKAAALKRTDERFPCVHMVTPVDPTNCRPVGPSRWSVACRKIDWARYAIDYAQPQPAKD
jgi:hypothetical protein